MLIKILGWKQQNNSRKREIYWKHIKKQAELKGNWKIEFGKQMRTREAKIAKNTAKVTSMESQCNRGYCGQSQTISASLHIKAQLEHSLP